MSFNFKNNGCSLILQTDTMTYQLAFGAGNWQTAETTKRGPSLVGAAKASFVGLPPLKIDGAYSWTDEHTLELTLRYIESPHTEKFICHFDEKNIAADITSSFDYGTKKTTLKGSVKE